MDASGERCHTLPQLRERALRVLAATGRSVSFKIGRLPARSGIEPPRGELYEQGCAIAVDAYPVYPEPDVVSVEVEIWSKGA